MGWHYHIDRYQDKYNTKPFKDRTINYTGPVLNSNISEIKLTYNCAIDIVHITRI